MSSSLRAPVPALFLSLLFLVGCSSPATIAPDAAASDAAAPDAAPPATWSFETLDTRTVRVFDVDRDLRLIRAHRPDGGTSYLAYLPPRAPGSALMILTMPYSGIDWTGEDVDARWAARGAGAHPDDDAPGYDGDDLIGFEPQTIEAAAEQTGVWVYNGFAALLAYGRFYAGGSIEDDVEDSIAPYEYARTLDEVDHARIGAWGGSWGGFMVIYGAAHAPADVAPRAIVALAPPSDFASLWAYTDAIPTRYPDPAAAEAFFSPYRRRIAAATGGAPPSAAFEPYSHTSLCARLRGDALIPHDEWDTLVPFEQTPPLVACGAVESVVWHRQTPVDYAAIGLDHGAFGREPGYPSAYTFATLFLVHRLAGPLGPIASVASEGALAEYLATVRDEQLAGGDPAEALPRLREVVDPRVTLLDPVDAMFRPGAEVLARAATTVYGRAYDAASLRAQLETGLPPP